jgi:DNA-binding transcriptional MerR regulator
MSIFRLGILEVRRTTSLIGELIALTTEQEETLTTLGKEGHRLYKARRIYDEATLELCRKVDMTMQQIREKKGELEEALEVGFGPVDPGAAGTAKKVFFHQMSKREIEHHERLLREDYDELGNRVVWLSQNDPRSLTPRIVRMCTTLARLKRDIDWRWEELQERTRNEQKGPMFLFVLNMFIINFFRFSNYTWFRHWVRKMEFFQEQFMERIHKQTEEEIGAPEPPPAPPSAEPEEAKAGEGTGWHRPGLKLPDYHGAPADTKGGFFGPREGEAVEEAAPPPPLPRPPMRRPIKPTDAPTSGADEPPGPP